MILYKKMVFFEHKKREKRDKIDFALKLHFLNILAKIKEKIKKKANNMAKKCVLDKKGPFLDPKKGPKVQKIDFLLKLHFLHFLAKFKQKIPKKSKNMAEKAVFGPKKGHFRTRKKDKNYKNRLFIETSLFTLFIQI